MKNTLEELTRNNATHIDTHGPLDEEDVARINKVSDIIEKNRGNVPQIGDVVEVFTRKGEYFPHAHIAEINPNGTVVVCASGGLAVVNSKGEMSRVSGGPWMTLDVQLFSPNGEYVKDFQFYRPAAFYQAHAMVIFQAKVRRWKYANPNPLYGNYSEKDYYRCLHHIFSEKDSKMFGGYRHYAGSKGFRTEEDYLAWLITYKGVEFKGEFRNTVFVYRREEILIDKAEWDALKLPTDTRMINASIVPIKFHVDDKNHYITEFRYTNCCEKDEYWGPEYRVARGQLRSGDVQYSVRLSE